MAAGHVSGRQLGPELPTAALNSVLFETSRKLEASEDRVARFLSLGETWEALGYWLSTTSSSTEVSRDHVVGELVLAISRIDKLISDQLNVILHDPLVQRIESTWRGLRHLTQQVADGDNVKIRLLDISWRELSRDMDRAVEFDQSEIFDKVYTQEFGTPGGEPYGVLIGDYEVTIRRSAQHKDDVGTLRGMSQVAAAAFAPFIVAASPELFGLDSFRELERPIDLTRTFGDATYTGWNSLRRIPDARFVGLTLPRMLMRRPWQDLGYRSDGFRFHEDSSIAGGGGLLWGNAAFALCEVLIRTFVENGWMAAIRGVSRDLEVGGIVTQLAQDWHNTDKPGLISKGSLEVQLTDDQELELSELGFIPLIDCQGTGFAAFYGNQSMQAWRQGGASSRAATHLEVNAKLSSMLQYIFCVSRFSHYVKVLARDRAGSYTTARQVQDMLTNWLIKYATANPGAPADMQAKYPLRDAKVEVRDTPGAPGVYACVVHLQPHYQLDDLDTSVKLVTELYAGHEL